MGEHTRRILRSRRGKYHLAGLWGDLVLRVNRTRPPYPFQIHPSRTRTRWGHSEKNPSRTVTKSPESTIMYSVQDLDSLPTILEFFILDEFRKP
jgi:hypothetical protein